MSNREKGLRRELQARKILKNKGYLVEKKNTSRWESDDFWEMFDIIALKKNGSEIRLIQVKSHISHFYTARKDVAKWKKENGVTNIKCEVWVKENYKDWRKDEI